MRLIYAIAATLALVMSSVEAHEWYPPGCCSGTDCAPLERGRVEHIPTGFLVDHTFFVPRSEAKDSMDGRYHGCFPTPTNLRCFFAPVPGS